MNVKWVSLLIRLTGNNSLVLNVSFFLCPIILLLGIYLIEMFRGTQNMRKEMLTESLHELVIGNRLMKYQS